MPFNFKSIKLFFLLIFIFSFKLSAFDPPSLEIYQVIDLALQNNPQTKNLWWKARRQAAAQGIAQSSYYPDIAFRANIAHGYDYQFPNGREVVYTNFEAGILVSYLLLDFGEREAGCKAAAAAIMNADWQLNWTMQKVIYDVLNSAYTYFTAQEILISKESSLKDLNESFESVEELFRCGLRTITDLYAIKAMVAEAEMDIILQKSAVEIAIGNLNISMGMSIDNTLNLMPLPDPPMSQLNFSALSSMARSAELQRADLQAKFAELYEKEAILNKVTAAYQPKLRFDGDAGFQRYVKDKAKGFDYNVALTLNVPLCNGGETAFSKRMAWADVQAANFEIEQYKLTIAKEVAVYSKQFEASQSLFKVVLSYVENAECAFECSLERYRAGTISIFDLSAAQRLLAEARIRRAEAKSSWYVDLAGLSFSMGVIANKEKLCIDH